MEGQNTLVAIQECASGETRSEHRRKQQTSLERLQALPEIQLDEVPSPVSNGPEGSVKKCWLLARASKMTQCINHPNNMSKFSHVVFRSSEKFCFVLHVI